MAVGDNLKVALTDCRPLRSAEDGRGNGNRPLSSLFIGLTFPTYPIPELLQVVLFRWKDGFERAPNLQKSGSSLKRVSNESRHVRILFDSLMNSVRK